jgi:hypothetical protein
MSDYLHLIFQVDVIGRLVARYDNGTQKQANTVKFERDGISRDFRDKIGGVEISP